MSSMSLSFFLLAAELFPLWLSLGRRCVWLFVISQKNLRAYRPRHRTSVFPHAPSGILLIIIKGSAISVVPRV